MKKEINVTKQKTTYIIQAGFLLITLFLFKIILSRKVDLNQLLMELVIIFVSTLLSKFPHEFCHYIVARALGFKSKIKFGFLVSKCQIIGTLTYKEVILTSIAPMLFFAPASIILLALNIDKPVFFFILVYWLSTMVGDFQYMYHALTNKSAKFVDEGTTLIITKD